MPTIRRFEDIEAWRSARVLVQELYRVTTEGAFARDYDLRNQLRRAAVSIMSNIAEGFERRGNREFRRFLFIAKGSAGEVRSLLYVAADSDYISASLHSNLFQQTVAISGQLANFIRYLDDHLDELTLNNRALREAASYAYDSEPVNLQTFQPFPQPEEKSMKTYGLTLMLQDDQAKIEEYKKQHLAVWPAVTARLREVGVHEMRIFLRGLRMFMYIETTDDFDPIADFARVNEQPESAEWNRLMADLQARAPEATPEEWWAPMELVFDMSWPQHRN